MTPTRREILLLTAMGLAGDGLAGLAGGGLAAAPADALARLFADRDAAAAIGRAYLLGHPGPPPDLASLRNAMLQALQLEDADLRDSEPAALRGKFRDRIRQDFATGETVTIDGWILSLVEAQACAIACLGRAV